METLNICPTGNLPTIKDRAAHPEKYFTSMYNALKEIEAANTDLTVGADEIQTEVTKTWCFSICRSFPEWRLLSRRRRSRVIRSLQQSINHKTTLNVTAFGSESRPKLQQIVNDTIRRIDNSRKYKESQAGVQRNDCFVPDSYTYIKAEKLFVPLPQYSMCHKYVTIDQQTLAYLLHGTSLEKRKPQNVVEVANFFAQVFKVPIPTFADMESDAAKIFTNIVRTDGVAIDFLYVKKQGKERHYRI